MASLLKNKRNFYDYVIVFVVLLNFCHSEDEEYFFRHPFKVITVSSFIKILQVERELECAFACSKNSQCKSFNFASEKNLVGKFTCQLLAVDLLEESLAENPKFHHYEKFQLNPCLSSPCLNGGTCNYRSSTRDMTCRCKLGFSGPLCQAVQWTKFTTSPVCFGATGDSFASFNIPKTGSLITTRLVHISGQLTCEKANVNGWNHWGCLDNSGKPQYMSVLITDNSNNIKLPGSDKIIANAVWNSIGIDPKSNELVFPSPAAIISVVSGEQYRIWFGQDLSNQSDTDNDGRVCVDVYGLYQNS